MPPVHPSHFSPLASPTAERPPLPRRSYSGNASLMFPLDLAPGPTPPALSGRTLAPPEQSPGVSALTYALDSFRLTPSPSSRSPARSYRSPSPLPPPLKEPLPSEIESMSIRLTALVQQSNAYVAGLKSRLDAVEDMRASWNLPATKEQLTVFLEATVEFSGLDVDRLVSFHLPLQIWQQLADQVLVDHPTKPKSIESILYWRARAEAEALGFLQSDRRSSSASSVQTQSAGDSRRPSVASVASLYGSDSPPSADNVAPRRSIAAGNYFAPRKKSSADAGVATITE